MGIAPRFFRPKTHTFISGPVIFISRIAFVETNRHSRLDLGIALRKCIRIQDIHDLLQFGDELVIEDFRFFEVLGRLDSSFVHRKFDLLVGLGRINLHQLGLHHENFASLDRSDIHQRKKTRGREFEHVGAFLERINCLRKLLQRSLFECGLEPLHVALEYNDTGQGSFVQNLPLAVLDEQELRHTGRINEILVEVEIVFVLECLLVLRSVETHLGDFEGVQMRILEAKGVKFLEIVVVQLPRNPLVFLRTLLVPPVEGICLQREDRLLRNEGRPLHLDSHVRNGINHASGRKLVRCDLEILVGIGKRKRRDQQQ